jgi:CRP/FNR family transcriptional regulator, cyclic AMP receptor protein
MGLDKERVISGHAFFKGLEAEILSKLIAFSRTRPIAAGEMLFRKGDEGSGMIAILSGSVRVSATSSEGRDIILNILGAGDVIGEIALLDGGPRTADAVALTDGHLLVLERRHVLPLVHAHPALAQRLISVLCERVRRTSAQVEDLSFMSPSVRLARVLLRLAHVQLREEKGQAVISITQRELGDAISLSRESTNRLLQSWVQDGSISLGKGKVRLLQPKKLETLAGTAN